MTSVLLTPRYGPCRSMTIVRNLLAAATVITSSSVAGAQMSDSLRADSAFVRQDWRSAAELYQRITSRAPESGHAWLRLGMARHAIGELRAAIPAYERARALRFQVPSATYRLARAHAASGDVDRAFAYLDTLVPMRAIIVPVLDTASEFVRLRGDPRYAALAAKITALRYPCRSNPRAREFDFWIGDWNVTPWAAAPSTDPASIGTNGIELLLEQCMLLENWTGAGGGAGKSINFFDTNRSAWRQVWVADGGGSLDYAGAFRDGAMRFEGWTLGPNGARVLQKLTFFPISADTVRQLFETSADSGRTWQSGFDGRYVRRRPR